MRRILFTLWLCLLLPNPLAALEITSVSPATVSSGTAVTVIGGPFGKGVKIILGDRQIAPTPVGERQLIFTVPSLGEGEYALFLQEDEQTSQQIFTLKVVEPTPWISALNPSNVDICSTGAARRVLVEGKNFQPGASLLLDGAAVSQISMDERHITFMVPPLPGGIHEVQVVNPSGKKSLSHSLFINNVPEIVSVQQGTDYVNSYELIIEGKNFLYSSILVVNGKPIVRSAALPPQTDNVKYVGCNRVIYLRYPYSHELKRVSLQLINPEGKESPVYYVTIP
jgi:hypothetical protein